VSAKLDIQDKPGVELAFQRSNVQMRNQFTTPKILKDIKWLME
jgi:hypothetical protein